MIVTTGTPEDMSVLYCVTNWFGLAGLAKIPFGLISWAEEKFCERAELSSVVDANGWYFTPSVAASCLAPQARVAQNGSVELP